MAVATATSEVVRRSEILPLTCAQYAEMIDSGIIPDGTPCELLEGIIVHKDRGDPRMGHSPRHGLAVRRLIALAARIDTPARHLQVQLPLDLGDGSCPEPDAAVVQGSDRDFIDRLPTARHVACVIEVADSSLERDRSIKARIYARAGIPQYLLINLAQRHVELFTHPHANAYTQSRIFTHKDTLTLDLGASDTLNVPVTDLLD